jgi:O-antigen/teichoic acid export membrane protein
MPEHTFLRHAAVYGLANMLVRAGSFILVPLYLHTMTQAEYGVVEILDRLGETVGTMLLIGGLRQALLTFYQQTDDDQERQKVFGAAMLLVALSCGLIGALAVTFAQPISELLTTSTESINQSIQPDLLRLAVLAILLEPLSQMPLALIQSRVHSGTYLLVSVSQFTVRVALCFVLVGWLRWGVWGVLLATVSTSAVYGMVLSGWGLLSSGAWPGYNHVRALLRFALPFLPGGIGFLIMQHGDRFFLLKSLGQEEVAIYGLGYRLALGVGMFSLGPLYMVWSSAMYKAARSPDAPIVFGRALTRILAAYVYVGLGLCMFQDEIVAILGGSAYAHAARIVTVVVVAGFFQTAAALMDAGLYVRRRSGLKVGITLSSTLVMSLLYCVLIPYYGSMGAALATLGGFAFLALVTWMVSQCVFPVRYEWSRLILLVSLGSGTWLIAHYVPATWSWSPLKLGLLAGVPMLAWKTGLVSSAEKAYLSGLALTLRNALFGRLLSWPGQQLGTKHDSIPETRSVAVPADFSNSSG